MRLDIWLRLPALAAVLLALVACAGPKPPAEDLALPVNLLCTTCNDFFRCERGAQPGGTPAPMASGGDVLIYRLEEKRFWAQVATIGDYMFQLFRRKTSDARPASIWRRDGGVWTIERGLEARIDATARSIAVGDVRFDQRTGAWFEADGDALGACTALRRREGFALVREALGKPALAASETR